MIGHGRPQEDRSRRRWSALLLALVAVAGLAATQAGAQSKVPRMRPDDRDTDGFSIPANSLALNGGAITLAGDAETNAVLLHAAVDAGRYGRVNGKLTIVSAVRQTIVRTWKHLTDGILDFVAPYRVTRSYPTETPCPGES